MKKWTLILFALCSMLAFAQAAPSVRTQVPDTTYKAVADTAAADTLRGIFGYKMQSRFRPENEKAATGRLLNNTFIYAMGTYYHPYAENYGSGPLAGGGIGRWFSDKNGLNRYHGVRIGASLGYFFDNYNANRVKFADVRASYMFDLSAYVGGYKKERLVSVVPVAGLGFALSEGSGKKLRNGALSVHLGADLQMHVLPGIDFVIEPLFELQQDSRRLTRLDIWRKYIPTFRGNVGVSLNLDYRHWIPDPGEEWRITMMGGLQLQDPQLSKSLKTGLLTRGPYGAFGAIRSYRDWFDWRVLIGYSRVAWSVNPKTDDPLISEYAFVRLDAVAHIWGPFYVFAGPEAGGFHKEGVSNLNPYPYVGLSGGIQLKQKFLGNYAVFLEPRATIIPYVSYSNKKDITFDNYWDILPSLSLGVEVPVKKHPRRHYSETKWNEGLFAYVSGTSFNPFVPEYSSGPYAQAGIGKWFQRRWAVRVGGGFGYYTDNKTRRYIKDYIARGALLFNVLSPERPVMFGPVVGAGGSLSSISGGGRMKNLSAQFGLNTTLPLMAGIDMFIEPSLELHFDRRYQSRNGEFRFLPAFTGSVGISACLETERWRAADPGRDWRVSLGAGVNSILSDLYEKEGGFGKSLGPTFLLGISRQYSKCFTWRFTGGFSGSHYLAYNKLEPAYNIFGRLDAMLDFFALGKSEEPHRFSLSLAAGPEAGLFRKLKLGYRHQPYVGLSGGIQLKGKVTPALSVWIEPRATVYPVSDRFTPKNELMKNSADMLSSIAIGVEYKLGGK